MRARRLPSGSDPRVVQIYRLLRRVHDLIGRSSDRSLAELDLSSAQYSVLRSLADGEELSLSELSRRLVRGHSNLTTLIGRMVQKGLVEKLDEATDRRVTKVRLTPKGRRLRDQVVPLQVAYLEGVFGALDPQEQEVLSAFLERIHQRLLEEGEGSLLHLP